ncbi:surface-adhesin E family protein [Acinetobacter higginsii]|uniref:surface-adhesin E family protein n=1 Tax=Acinetobacter higginsii TaxID=70347 RepID=UPI00300B156C
MKNLFILCLLIATSSHSFADDWFQINETDESKFYINVPSISETNSYGKKVVKAWIKDVIYNDLTKDGLSVGDNTMSLFYSNCEDNTVGIKSITQYKNGKVFGSQISNSYVNMKDVIPNSIGQSILTYSCEGMRIKKEGKAGE